MTECGVVFRRAATYHAARYTFGMADGPNSAPEGRRAEALREERGPGGQRGLLPKLAGAQTGARALRPWHRWRRWQIGTDA